jgi:pilus assembly protein Flp/PilA
MQEMKFVLQNESGQDMVEYALVMGLIAMGAVVAMKGLAASIGTGLTSIGAHVSTDTS